MYTYCTRLHGQTSRGLVAKWCNVKYGKKNETNKCIHAVRKTLKLCTNVAQREILYAYLHVYLGSTPNSPSILYTPKPGRLLLLQIYYAHDGGHQCLMHVCTDSDGYSAAEFTIELDKNRFEYLPCRSTFSGHLKFA